MIGRTRYILLPELKKKKVILWLNILALLKMCLFDQNNFFLDFENDIVFIKM